MVTDDAGRIIPVQIKCFRFVLYELHHAILIPNIGILQILYSTYEV